MFRKNKLENIHKERKQMREQIHEIHNKILQEMNGNDTQKLNLKNISPAKMGSSALASAWVIGILFI